MLSASEVANQLRVSPRTVHRWACVGTLPGYRIGRVYRFKPEDVELLLESHKCQVVYINVKVRAPSGSITPCQVESEYDSLLERLMKKRQRRSSSS